MFPCNSTQHNPDIILSQVNTKRLNDPHLVLTLIYFRDHPDYPGFTEEGLAEKICESDGGWWRDPRTNLTFSDYNPCVPDWSFHEAMSLLRVAGNLTSLTGLVASLLIFTLFHSSLKCGRVTMHMNLFLAFIMR